MSTTQLIRDMEEWAVLTARIEELEDSIADAVLTLEKTQVVSNCRATYGVKGGKTDYQGICTAVNVPFYVVEEYITRVITEKISWAKVVADPRVSSIIPTDVRASFTTEPTIKHVVIKWEPNPPEPALILAPSEVPDVVE